MSHYFSQLCTLLVEDIYGDFFSHIFSTLLTHGRLQLPRLAQRCHLSLRQARHGLACMAQTHLIFHYTSPADGQTYYEVNAAVAYDLVRSGKAVELVRKKFGAHAAAVMMHLLLSGHARVSDLEEVPDLFTRYSKPKPKPQNVPKKDGESECVGNATNGIHGDKQEEPGDLPSTLRLLADHKLIYRVRDAHLRSQADNQTEVERHVRATQVFEKKGKALQAEIEEKIETAAEELYDGTLSKAAFQKQIVNGTKRKADDDDDDDDVPPRKKRVRQEKDYNSHSPSADEVIMEDATMHGSANLVIRANLVRVAALLRNDRLVMLAEHELGHTTSQVYHALLEIIDQPKFRPHVNRELSPDHASAPGVEMGSVSMKQILDGVEDKIKALESLAHVDAAKVNKAWLRLNLVKREQSPSGASDEDVNSESEGDEEDYVEARTNGGSGRDYLMDDVSNSQQGDTLGEVEEHLLLLAQSPRRFAAPTTAFNNARWTVSFRSLSTHMRRVQLFHLVKARFGPSALRLVRILEGKGRLDEKRLQDLALLTPKECRMLLELLNKAGFVEIQEVPRDTHRQPSRTMYLWFYDADRVRKTVLEDTYKAMARCLQRMKVEREKHGGVLENAERSDIKGKEEELLPEGEKGVLKLWKKKEERLLGELGRLDELVGILRDD